MPSQAPSNSHLRSQKNKSHFPLLRLFAEYGCPVSALSCLPPENLQGPKCANTVQSWPKHWCAINIVLATTNTEHYIGTPIKKANIIPARPSIATDGLKKSHNMVSPWDTLKTNTVLLVIEQSFPSAYRGRV